ALSLHARPVNAPSCNLVKTHHNKIQPLRDFIEECNGVTQHNRRHRQGAERICLRYGIEMDWSG
ncbi:MAG: hypothetical protein ABGW90_12720, partial [Martelella sp.]